MENSRRKLLLCQYSVIDPISTRKCANQLNFNPARQTLTSFITIYSSFSAYPLMDVCDHVFHSLPISISVSSQFIINLKKEEKEFNENVNQ